MRYIRSFIFLSWLSLVSLLGLASMDSSNLAVDAARAGAERFIFSGNPAFHLQEPIGSELPFDVNIDALRRLSANPAKKEPPFDIPPENVAAAQRLFDVYSWRAFLALNWPAKPDGAPDTSKNLADSRTPRVWEDRKSVV